MISPSDLPITDDLQQAINEWAAVWDAAVDRYLATREEDDEAATNKFDDAGRVIWRRLQNELGHAVRFEYYSTTERQTLTEIPWLLRGLRTEGGLNVTIMVDADDVEDDNIDVVVTDREGQRWSATVYTIKNVRTVIERWKASGEHGGGVYFWGGPDAIIVEELSDNVVARAIDALWEDGDFESALNLLEDEVERD